MRRIQRDLDLEAMLLETDETAGEMAADMSPGIDATTSV